jgi:hypothetical protein
MRSFTVTFPTVDALRRWFPRIKGYDLGDPTAGVDFYQEDMEPYYINGTDLVEAVLEEMNPYVESATVDVDDTTVVLNLRPLLYDYLLGTGSRASDYSEEDLLAELGDQREALGILTGIKREMEIHVDPYRFQREDTAAQEDHYARCARSTKGSENPRKEPTMIQRSPESRGRRAALLNRARARTAMKQRIDAQRVDAQRRLARRMAALRAARAERQADTLVPDRAEPRRPPVRRAAPVRRPVPGRIRPQQTRPVATRSDARDTLRRRIAMLRRRAALVRQRQATHAAPTPEQRLAALRTRLAARRQAAGQAAKRPAQRSATVPQRIQTRDGRVWQLVE